MPKEDPPSGVKPKSRSKRKVVVSHSGAPEEAAVKPDPTRLEEYGDPNPEPQESRPPPSEKKGQATWVVGVLLMGVLATFYLGHQNQQHIQGLRTLQNQGLSSQQHFEHDIKALHAQLKRMTEHLSKLESLQAEQEAQQQATHTRLMEVTGRGHEGWILAEAQFLIRTAYERLAVDKDIKVALRQLASADERLKTLGDPSLASVREALVRDMAALKKAIVPDKEGLWLRLGEMMEQIGELRLNETLRGLNSQEPEPASVGDDSTSSAPTSTQEPWKRALQSSWQELKGLIRVTRDPSTQLTPLLSHQEKAELTRSLALVLEQARWALLVEKQDIYVHSLNQVQALLNIYYEDNHQLTRTLRQLDELKHENILSQLPSLSESFVAINQALQRIDQQHEGFKAPSGLQENA